MNMGTNKFRITKKTRRKLKAGNEESNNLISSKYHKYNNSIMVSGGICNEGLAELIFHSGNLNNFVYKQVIKYYKEDLDKFRSKIFQQDGARSQSSKLSRNMI